MYLSKIAKIDDEYIHHVHNNRLKLKKNFIYYNEILLNTKLTELHIEFIYIYLSVIYYEY